MICLYTHQFEHDLHLSQQVACGPNNFVIWIPVCEYVAPYVVLKEGVNIHTKY